MHGKAEPRRGKGQLFAMKQAPYKNFFIWPLTTLEVDISILPNNW